MQIDPSAGRLDFLLHGNGDDLEIASLSKEDLQSMMMLFAEQHTPIPKDDLQVIVAAWINGYWDKLKAEGNIL